MLSGLLQLCGGDEWSGTNQVAACLVVGLAEAWTGCVLLHALWRPHLLEPLRSANTTAERVVSDVGPCACKRSSDVWYFVTLRPAYSS